MPSLTLQPQEPAPRGTVREWAHFNRQLVPHVFRFLWGLARADGDHLIKVLEDVSALHARLPAR